MRPPSDIPTRAAAVRGERLHHDRHVAGEVVDGPGTVAAAVGMAVSREVDGEQGPSERERDAVPGVSVLGATVEQHELGVRVAPRQG